MNKVREIGIRMVYLGLAEWLMGECLPVKHETLSSSPNITTTTKKKKKGPFGKHGLSDSRMGSLIE
jgi:hypothetical protein